MNGNNDQRLDHYGVQPGHFHTAENPISSPQARENAMPTCRCLDKGGLFLARSGHLPEAMVFFLVAPCPQQSKAHAYGVDRDGDPAALLRRPTDPEGESCALPREKEARCHPHYYFRAQRVASKVSPGAWTNGRSSRTVQVQIILTFGPVEVF